MTSVKTKHSQSTVNFFILICILFSVGPALSAEQKLTPFDVNRKLLSFTDNYQESISETVDKIIASGIDPTSRMIYQTIKVFYTSSAIDIATESDAVHQLMDMMIMVRLQRIVWDKGGHELSKPEHAEKMATRLKKLEDNLHFVANQVFDQNTINQITALAAKWQKDNPTREYIAFVRFQDFAASETKAQIEKTIAKGGLFSSLSEANREIEETRFAVERAMFIANHLPILVEWQAELFLYKTLSTDEIRSMISNGEALQGTSEKLLVLLETLPTEVNKEVQTLLDNNYKPLKSLSSEMASTAENLKIVSENFSSMFASEQDGNSGTLNISDIQEITLEVKNISSNLITLSEKLKELEIDENTILTLSDTLKENMNAMDSLITNQRDTMNYMVHEQQNRFGFIIAGLIILFFFCFTISMLIIKRHK